MAKWTVILPVSGLVEIHGIEAETEEEAIQVAFNAGMPDAPDQWEVHEHICEGNVCHAIQWDAEAVKED